MPGKDRFLVVISVLEGRRFPKRPRHKIIAEARFDGELLATDPVDHVENPDFTQELAWELNKKALQQHRLQRTSIKIQLYAYDVHSTLKEAIGYVVLDLRSASANKQVAKYYQILHSKYHKSKPEIRLALYLDDDKTPQPDSSEKPIVVPSAGRDDGEAIDPKAFVPVLNDEEGYYQIGSAAKHTEHFVLSVTIAHAANLAQLIPSTTTLPAGAHGYFFYYSLLGNDVTNENFSDLIKANFPAERASVRVRSSVDALRLFLSNQPGLQIHLCCGDQSLGSANISLGSLIKKGSTEIYMRPVTIDGAFELVPPNLTKKELPSMSPDLMPTVGVSIVLRKEDQVMKTPVKGSTEKLNTIGSSPVLKSPIKQEISKPGERPQRAEGHMASHKAKPEEREKKSHKGKLELREKVAHKTRVEEEEKVVLSGNVEDNKDNNYTDDFEEGNSLEVRDTEVAHGHDKPQSELIRPVSSVSTDDHHHQSSNEETTSESTTLHHMAIPPQSHHFTFSIDLRSIRDLVSTTTHNVFLRYTYQFFGSAAPILTHPPLEIRKGSEVLLPRSFCAFDFACTLQQLQDTFFRVPLIVEVWNHDHQLSQDFLVGVARLPLGNVISSDKSRVMSDSGFSGWRQEYSDRLVVTAPDGKQQRVAELSVVLSLEDWGPMPAQPIMNNQPVQTAHTQMPPGMQSRPAQADDGPTDPRKTAEYQTALELEMWKEKQEQVFENQLKEKEMMCLKALGEEWKKRDREREVLVQKKMTEYARLEEKLQRTLLDLEKRERQLAANEQEVMRLRADLLREHDRKLQEMKEASHRMKSDCDHQIDLERMKVKEYEEIIARYKQELLDAEKKYKNLEKEFAIYKEQQNTKPEVRLQSEINLLTLEKVELERKLDALTKSKVHYKQQWGRALKELARLKQKEQDLAKAHLKRQQQELEHMRLRYLAAEEKDVVNSEKKELQEIKNELNRLRQLEEEKLKQLSDSNILINSPRQVNDLKGDLNASLDDHITRLIEERDTLLRTGVYTTQDKIIAELDRQIREAIAQKNS
ncbi:centrosomal protein of 120 kDa-like [Gigantopelta aegis]|uniref:centrosomal protein of 120 kDa-like n=1 Tax=Gigantopelta aegis TaxID=1735272 RepID=UPI001B8881FA|nr:centrosomal protein of 120 kDa-like [Gigantopelta aegis]